MSINVNGLAASRKTPGINLAVVLGGPGTSAGAASNRIAILGNKITTNLTGASPSFTVTAGTAATATPVSVYSADEASTLFGAGSELHLMARAIFAQYPDASVVAVPVAESAGAAADVICTFATSASAAFTVRLRHGGDVVDVAVANGDSATAIATAVATAILQQTHWPFTAQYSTGAVTVAAKNVGPRGNALVLRMSFVNSSGTETLITSSSTSSGASTTGQLSSGAALGSEYAFAGGTTADDVTAALAAMEPERYHRIAAAHVDSTNIDLIVTHINSQAGVTVQKREQAIVPSYDTLANATTLATGRNAARLQVAWHYAAPVHPCVLAAQCAAARLIGDGAVGGTLVGESTTPSANLDGVNLASVPMQYAIADRPTSTEIESALNNGLTPVGASGSRPGYGAIVRSITSRSLVSGVQNYAVIDTSQVTVPDWVADSLQSDLATTFAGARLGAAASNGAPPTAAGVVTTTQIRDRIAYDLKLYEGQGVLRDVDANMSLLAVEENALSPGRVDCEIPCEPVPSLHMIGGNVRQLT